MTFTRNLALLLVSLLSLISVPPIYYVVGNASSMSIGLLVACIITISLLGLSLRTLRFWGVDKWLVFSVSLVFMKILYDVVIQPNKADIVALIGLVIIVLAAKSFAVSLRNSDPRDLANMFVFVSAFLIVFLLLSSFYSITIQNYSKYPKNVFPFSEPSHYAIFCTPLIAVGFIFAPPIWKIFLFSSLLVGALSILSLILAVQTMLLTFIYIVFLTRRFALVVPVLILIFFSAVTVMLIIPNLEKLIPDYFVSRILFYDTQNVSSLVYLQGWDRVFISILETSGLGAGFQNLDALDRGKHGWLLFDLYRLNQNLNDGGFLLAKIVGELGVFGAAFCIFYIFVLIKSFRELPGQLRLIESNFDDLGSQPKTRNAFYRLVGGIFVIFFSIELFGRGTGYFSLGLFLFAVGIFLRAKNTPSAKIETP